MKTIIKLVVAAAIVNATVRLGRSAWEQYQFRDDVQQLLLFGGRESTAQLTQEILDAAGARGLPLEARDVDVRRQGMLTTAQASYVDAIEVFPRYVYPMTWEFRLDARRVGGQ